jgi:hypothetical protein
MLCVGYSFLMKSIILFSAALSIFVTKSVMFVLYSRVSFVPKPSLIIVPASFDISTINPTLNNRY